MTELNLQIGNRQSPIDNLLSIDAGEPRPIRLPVCLHVMPAACIPPVAAWLQDRARCVFHFRVLRGGEFQNVESPDARAVLRHAVLGKTDHLVVQHQQSAARARTTLVTAYYW